MRILAILPLIALSGTAHALTLEQSVAEALNKNPRLLQKYARFEAKYRDKRTAFSEYLPQIRLYAAYGYENVTNNSGNSVDTEMDRRELGLRISQMLFDGFKTSSDVARLDYEMRADQQSLVSEAENIGLEVSQVYLDLIKAQEIVKLQQQNVVDHQNILKDIQSRKSKGLSSDADVAQVQARLSTAQSGLLAAKNNQFDLEANYYDLVGGYPDNLMVPKPDANYVPKDLKQAIQLAVTSHPEVSAANLDINAANKQIERDKSGYWPKLALELDVNDNENIGGFEGPDDDARIMLTMSYDLYNGGRTNAKTEASKWRYQEATAVRDNTLRQVTEGTKLAWNAYTFVGEQKNFYQQNVDFASQAQQGYDKQFDLGRRSLLDVLDSKIELFVARRNYLNAAFDERKASYRLINATGKLVEALRVDTPEAWQIEDDKE
ncbi:TolC family outer membrane protein [Pseudoalteromonas sp.]|uniref:TolC family outer membrane protein n=1 Tax=Pseudoalteromonas sp. TaxID=53249 RepID=UPI003002BB6F